MDFVDYAITSFYSYLASSSSNIPSFIRKNIQTSIKNDNIIFTQKVYEPNQLVTYYGPKRQIIIQRHSIKSLTGSKNVPQMIVSGIVGRSVLKYADIYGPKSIYKFFDDAIICYFDGILKKISKVISKENYIARKIAEYWASIYIDYTNDISEYYFRTGKFHPIIVRNSFDQMFSSISAFVRDDLDLPDEAVNVLINNIDTKLRDNSIFLYDIMDNKLMSINDIKRAFKDCLNFPFDYAPLISYIPGRELRMPFEILSRLMELYIYNNEVERYNTFVKFFSKVI